MQGSKIRLSNAELELFCNAEIILTKNSIVQKTVWLLQEVQNALVDSFTKNNQLSTTPKISKGENYVGLPYVILDYPRISNEEGLFFIRSMFWWGNFFSSTLQLSGGFKNQYQNGLEMAYELLSSKNYFIGINSNPWNHHFGEDNYRRISTITKENFASILQENVHIKIAAQWPLSEWDTPANKLIESWKLFMQLLRQINH